MTTSTPTPQDSPTKTPNPIQAQSPEKATPSSSAPPSSQTPSTPVNTPPAAKPKEDEKAAPSAKPVEPPSAAPPAPAPKPTREQKLAAACKSMFAVVKELVGFNFSHEGICTKCGWHSMQHSKEAAQTATDQHVMSHWKDVTAFVDSQK